MRVSRLVEPRRERPDLSVHKLREGDPLHGLRIASRSITFNSSPVPACGFEAATIRASPMWASLAIVVMWLAVLFDAASLLATIGPALSTTRIRPAVALRLTD